MGSPPGSSPDLAESPDESPAGSPLPSPDDSASFGSKEIHNPRTVAHRTASDPRDGITMSTTSSPLGTLSAARQPGAPPSAASLRAGALPQDMLAKMRAFHLSRQGAPPAQNLRDPAGQAPVVQVPSGAPVMGAGIASPVTPPVALGGMAHLALPPGRPHPSNWNSAPLIQTGRRAPKPSLGARRGLALPGGLPGTLSGAGAGPGNGVLSPDSGPGSAMNNATNGDAVNGESKPAASETGSMFNQFSEFVDTKTGTLRFAGKAVIHGKGVDFSSGSSFSISLDEVDTLEELGKGNYGTVYKVRHSRPRMRKPGQGLKGNRPPPSMSASATSAGNGVDDQGSAAEGTDGAQAEPVMPVRAGNTTGVVMAMKEIRLELDQAKFAAIIMELDILHRCVSPFIIDFYGAFFQEGAVYICMEYMDGGSIDKLYGDGVPENVLRKIALSTIMGLKTLKDDHNIIHRDVKPTNILVNTKGQVKICDFGVSGNLVASIAKTNIGCQSYMAPERIATGGVAQAGANPGGGTYSVQSDIWSLGLTIIECAMGRYPYAPETYNNIFSQLSAIVDGDPPDLPEEGFSQAARDFVRGCLNKTPKLRPTYAMLLRHPWLSELMRPPPIVESDEDAEDQPDSPSQSIESLPETADSEVAAWVKSAKERRKSGLMGKSATPALHAAPLDRAQTAA